jgi:hypothetical protein
MSYADATKKFIALKSTTPQPLKIKYRSELIAKLKENKIKEAENVDVVSPEQTYVIMHMIFTHLFMRISKFTSVIFSYRSSSWLSKINPFSKSSKTE